MKKERQKQGLILGMALLFLVVFVVFGVIIILEKKNLIS